MSDRILVSTRKGLFTVERQAPRQWDIARVSFPAQNVTLTLCDPRDGAWYAALDHGHFGAKMQRSTDDGATWAEITAPAYPEPPAGHEEKDMWGRKLEWKLQKIWALSPGHSTEPGVLWAGTLPGGLFRSRDRGASWDIIRSLWDHPSRLKWAGGGADSPGIHSICVDPRDARRVTLGVSLGGVWQTEDGGETWNNTSQGMRAAYMPPEQAFDVDAQDPHLVVQCGSEPDAFWSQHHNGIFKSTDGARNWTELTAVPPSVFGFAVAVHPRDPLTAWFVPAAKDEERIPVGAAVVVARTRDGGAKFDVLRRGLPQQHAYDLVFRHALAIDAGGDRLAFGSTTGSLWVTEDQGDTWHTVSNHLPPVYAVTFVPED